MHKIISQIYICKHLEMWQAKLQHNKNKHSATFAVKSNQTQSNLVLTWVNEILHATQW